MSLTMLDSLPSHLPCRKPYYAISIQLLIERTDCKRLSTPTTPNAPREMKVRSNYADQLRQKARTVRGRRARVSRRSSLSLPNGRVRRVAEQRYLKPDVRRLFLPKLGHNLQSSAPLQTRRRRSSFFLQSFLHLLRKTHPKEC